MTRLRAVVAAFGRDRSGSTAIEFSVVGLLMITILLAAMQFSLLFLSQMRLHDTLSDAATGANTALLNDSVALKKLICGNLILVNSCETKILLEKAPVANFSTSAQAITGISFTPGVSGDAMLLRAAADIVNFVPGLPTMKISGTALYARP